MARLKAIWANVVDSLWFIPAVLTLAGAVAAFTLVNFNDPLLGDLGQTPWWAFGGSAEGAAGVLGAIAGSIITVTGVVFSVTIVALQLASSQFTPRVLRHFTADRANQIVLGVFIGTFTYTLLVQRTLRTGDGADEFVPNVAVTGAVILALVSIGFLIFFINHAARAIQASVIIESVTRDTLAAVVDVFPERIEGEGRDGDPLISADEYTAGRRDQAYPINGTRAGYLQDIDRSALKRIAEQRHLFIRMEVEIGRYVLAGERMMSVWPAENVSDAAHELCDALVLGLERTPHHDLKLGVIELMDIAVKAMSPSVNDPTTALNAVDRLGEILLELAWRRRGDLVVKSPEDRALLIVRRPLLPDTVSIAFDQIRHYAASNPTVAIALVRQLGRLASLSPASARGAFMDTLHEVNTTATMRITDPVDRRRFADAAAEAVKVGSR